MAGNVILQPDGKGDILVENSYQNIVVVDPNKTVRSKNGQTVIEERLVDHENLIMYANLEVALLPRTKLNVGGTPVDDIETISIATINFLKPNNDEFTNTGYYDVLTGLGATEKKGTNQRQEQIVEARGKRAFRGTSNTDQYGRTIDPGLLGMTSIQTITNMSFIPEVTIEFEDIQGKALFEMGDQSPYAAFFNLPYPPFYLTMKGYYGQAIKYQLNLESFESRFNSQSGNYQITCRFKGYKYNILNEIQLGHLIALPHMYARTFQVSQSPITPESADDNSSNSSGTNVPQSENSNLSFSVQKINEKGRQKINELYSEYEAKGLIEPNFPRLTLAELGYKLQQFEQNIENTYKKVDFQVLTDGESYKKSLSEYYKKVYGQSQSWSTLFLDSTRPYYLISGEEVFIFKRNLDTGAKSSAIAELTAIIINYNKRLAENETFGTTKSKNLSIPNPITYNTMTANIDFANIDWQRTYRIQTNNSVVDPELLAAFIANSILQDFGITLTKKPDGGFEIVKDFFTFFVFEGPNRFVGILESMEGQLNQKLDAERTRITNELANKVVQADSGIGFTPTVRNVMAVIMASTEAFIRLLDDVHYKAWEVRQDPIRRDVVLNPSSSMKSSDDVNFVGTTSNASQAFVENSLSNIYPWPQVFQQNDDPQKPKFELMYPGDPDFVNLTKAYLYDKWPEVEFVEEYLKGTSQKYEPPVTQPSEDNQLAITKIVNINALEFPIISLAYLNKEEIKFLYEIYERQLIYSFYTGLARSQGAIAETNVIGLINTIESQNITLSLGNDNPYLTQKLKSLVVESVTSYENDLRVFSNNGTGLFWGEFIQDRYITPYLANRVDNPFTIENVSTLSSKVSNTDVAIPQTSVVNFEAYLKSYQSNPIQFQDTYPFTNNVWNTQNLTNYIFAGSPAVANNTANTYNIYRPKNIISNFTDVNDFTSLRPVTNFSYLNTSTLNSTTVSAAISILGPQELAPTVGYIANTPNSITGLTTTSMLNTPYFVNSILYGVQNEKNSVQHPYKTAAYLFLNSLPLATLRERYKNFDKINVQGDYIFASLKKFGAIHKIPYVWVLKIGSLWHRYKSYLETNNDILDPVWTDFNFVNNYDPITNNPSKTYVLNGVGSITLQNEYMVGAVKNTNIQPGFYPKLISDFNYFYNGQDLFTTYTNDEINKSIANGLLIQNLTESNINNVSIKDGQSRVTNVKPYSVVVPVNIERPNTQSILCNTASTKSSLYFVLPSFGSNFNQVEEKCFDRVGNITQELTNNNSLYNGSVRLFWNTPNYGYFDTSAVRKPNPRDYVGNIYVLGERPSFQLYNNVLVGLQNYTEIEEIQSVFNKKELDEMERHFLNFSQPITNFKLEPSSLNASDPAINNALNQQGGPYNEIDVKFRNFQQMFRALMVVSPTKSYTNGGELFTNIIDDQYRLMMSQFKSIMEYDVVLRVGNPTKYNRRAVSSYIGYVTNTSQVVSPIPFSPFGTTTPSTTQSNTILLEIGFGTDLNFQQYLTDFFVQSNIDINETSTKELSQICRQYITQRYENPSLTINEFVSNLQDYVTGNFAFMDETLVGTVSQAQKGLPNITQLPEGIIQSKYNFKQSKVDLYEAFKALNDKWIAGNDYKRKTLFEDMLFLDRASRDVGNKILIDIFQLKRVVEPESINYNMSVFTYMAGILTENHFTVMPLPAYVNFYNVQDATANAVPNLSSTQQFANDMWGTFATVDYRKSGPKLVCFYVDRPSSYVAMDNKEKNNFLFRSDSFDLRDPNNPLGEVITENKTDWAFSNLCVGFSVDIGIRSQNVFYSFSVTQTPGKATAETVATIQDMANQAGGRDTTTPNTSLYNIYQNRSYECDVVCLGNALLQPTMYFILRHVPMFNGSYLITEVAHTITPGLFQTRFKGTRQSFLSYPYPDNLLASINQNIAGNLIKSVLNRKDDASSTNGTTQQNNANTSVNPNTKEAAQNSCDSKVLEIPYKENGWTSTTGTKTQIPIKDFVDNLKLVVPNDEDLQFIIFCLSWASSGNSQKKNFDAFNNNYGKITLNYNYGEMRSYMLKTFSCVDFLTLRGPNEPFVFPIAHFESIEDYFLFSKNRLQLRVNDIRNRSIEVFYLQNWPYNKNNNITSNTELQTLLKEAKVLANNSGINSSITLLTPPPTPSPNPNNLGLINTITPSCS